jgi:[ribosomal protein S18]-alanine N-acetyltransferase
MRSQLLFWRRRPVVGSSRILRSADGAACARLHATSFAHPWPVNDFESLLLDPACSGAGLDARWGLAGFILSRRALDEAEILTIVVDPRLRRQGCGERLLASHLARLTRQGVATVFLEVDESNVAALALYRLHGFVEKGMRKGYYAKPDGTRANALIMCRSLA